MWRIMSKRRNFPPLLQTNLKTGTRAGTPLDAAPFLTTTVCQEGQTMKRALLSAAAAALLAATAFAQPPTVEAEAEGNVKIEGIAPEKVLGAIDTEKLVDAEKSTPATATDAKLPPTQVTTGTTVRETPTTVVELTTEVIAPVKVRPALDPENPIAPEVKAVVEAKGNYTTADLVRAQHEAVLATPVSVPTTIIRTTTTTPKSND